MKLWICNRGYWCCIVLAATEDEALELVKAAWAREEGWEDRRHPWHLHESTDPRVAVVGWT